MNMIVYLLIIGLILVLIVISYYDYDFGRIVVLVVVFFVYILRNEGKWLKFDIN